MSTLSNLISIKDLSKEQILCVLNMAQSIKKGPQDKILSGKLMASCFFEPSTRTRLSFEAAMKKLGGDVIGFSESKNTSSAKKETFLDSMKVISSYADLIVLRHPLDGAARYAQDMIDKPIINAGDGSNQHPTQTLVDLFSMQECQSHLEELHIAFAGDLKFARTIHSLVQASALFKMRMYFIAFDGLDLPAQWQESLKQQGIMFSFHQTLSEVIPKLDIVYQSRVQEERHLKEYGMKKGPFLTPELFTRAKPSLKIFHPLPRVHEIDKALDQTPFAYYFEQAANGLYVRQALLNLMMGNH